MVCIAAFIILCLVGIVVAFLSIFKREIGKKYWSVFKKAWHCVFKKVRLQKCDTNFKDDVKNTILKKVILKRPKLVKPLSITIEVVSVLIVAITIWSIVIAIKSLLALWVFGTCNVSKPSACSLTSESCSIDEDEPSNFFEMIGRGIGEWGEIFGAIPDRLRSWGEEDFKDMDNLAILNSKDSEIAKKLEEGSDDFKVAYDIIDPGCVVCMRSFVNQQKSGFMNDHLTYAVLYPITNGNGEYKFKNSGIATKYLVALQKVLLEQEDFSYSNDSAFYVERIINRLFTEKDEKGISYQTRLNNDLEEKEVVELFSDWLKEFGMDKYDIEEVEKWIESPEVAEIINKNKEIVDNKIHAKSIPTLIYDGKKHNGLYKE